MAELTRLANGVTVAIDPMEGAQSASIGLYAAVGSRSEADGKGGLAHLVEHMVFKGARRPRRARHRRGDRGCRRLAQRVDRARPDGVPRAHAGARRRARRSS